MINLIKRIEFEDQIMEEVNKKLETDDKPARLVELEIDNDFHDIFIEGRVKIESIKQPVALTSEITLLPYADVDMQEDEIIDEILNKIKELLRTGFSNVLKDALKNKGFNVMTEGLNERKFEKYIEETISKTLQAAGKNHSIDNVEFRTEGDELIINWVDTLAGIAENETRIKIDPKLCRYHRAEIVHQDTVKNALLKYYGVSRFRYLG